MTDFVPFDCVWPLVQRILKESDLSDLAGSELWFVRDLSGRVRILVPETRASASSATTESPSAALLERLAQDLAKQLGRRTYTPDQILLATREMELEKLRPFSAQRNVGPLTVHLVDRLVTGSEWATVDDASGPPHPLRFTLFSIKGGVGRSTTAAALASHLARNGKRVLVLDLDLESPGISAALLPRDQHPEFGIVDWFVEDLVGQGEAVLSGMVGRPEWRQPISGDVMVVPAYGANLGEYVAKLGRVYLDRVNGEGRRSWTMRLATLLDELERQEQPDVVILDSRSGLHDLAAAAVTDVAAHVLLFALDSESTWDGYRVLFQHWSWYDVARTIRERLSLVAALVPTDRREIEYLGQLRERAWDLFRESLYDEVPPNFTAEIEQELFSFALNDEGAPHDPMPIYRNEGLQALSSLRELPESAVDLAYQRFFSRFDLLMQTLSGGGSA